MLWQWSLMNLAKAICHLECDTQVYYCLHILYFSSLQVFNIFPRCLFLFWNLFNPLEFRAQIAASITKKWGSSWCLLPVQDMAWWRQNHQHRAHGVQLRLILNYLLPVVWSTLVLIAHLDDIWFCRNYIVLTTATISRSL